MKTFDDRVVAITGAASGIGRALAVHFAGLGAHLALCDIDADNLDVTAGQARRRGVRVETALVDVSERQAVETWAEAVVDQFGRVNVIVNNAGVAVTSPVDALGYEDFEWLMSINFWGVVYGTKAFLPYLRRARAGHIVNVSSVFGLIGVPSQAAYNAAKFAVRGFTESLRAEMELDADHDIGVTSVHPGGVKTNIAREGRYADPEVLDRTAEQLAVEFDEKLATLSPQDAADQIVEAVRKNKRRVLVGHDARAIDIVQRLFPSAYLGGLVRIFRRRFNR